MAASNRDGNPIEHLDISIDRKDLQDLTEEEMQLETWTDAVRCPDCWTLAEDTRIPGDWCIYCAQRVDSDHPTRKRVEDRLRVENRFWEKVEILEPDQCWEWQKCTLQAGGYGAFQSGGTRRAHVFVWELQHGEVPDGKQVNHHCDNRECVNTTHLYVGTQQDNARDMVKRERSNSQLPLVVVEEIDRRYDEEDISQTQLAEEFDTSQSVISRIVRGDSYEYI